MHPVQSLALIDLQTFRTMDNVIPVVNELTEYAPYLAQWLGWSTCDSEYVW